MATQLSESGLISNLTVAGFQFAGFTNFLALFGQVNGATRSTLRKAGITSGYQVPAAKNYKLRALTIIGNSGTTNSGQAIYSDNDIGFSSAAAPTNPVYQTGVINSQAITQAASAGAQASVPVYWDMPTGKYVGFEATNGGAGNIGVFYFGYEEA